MQQKLVLCLALACLAVLPALNARSLENGENELMEMAIQALEHGRALTAEESMVMQSGTYGAGGMMGAYGGSAGGILDSETTSPTQTTGPALESGSSNAPAASTTTPTTAKPAAAASTTAKSSALSAHQSAGLLAAGVMAAVFLL